MKKYNALVYTSNKKYILANKEELEAENVISNGSYIFDGYSKYHKKNLSEAIKIIAKSVIRGCDTEEVYWDGTKTKTIPFYKDIKDKNTGIYNYTFIKNIDLNK